ncbi:hypothetical protein ANN_10938 [Periplaneta americana]|uniref:Uncharacterized protein n=1 Tax=Periplaneta americana TaxID=6978 RepID=A0ABQ8T3M8_PERAM|nr:hypothetical protein ANN_10938 [Periplaneta americana]
MTRGKKREESESVEDMVKRVVKATWAEEAMRQGIANLIRELICEELKKKKTIEMNTSVIWELKNALAERGGEAGEEDGRSGAMPEEAESSHLWSGRN